MSSAAGARFAVVVVTKSPRPGHVKTRLCPPLSLSDAASLHAAFLRDTLNRLHLLADVEITVAYTPAEDRDLFEKVCPGALLLPQTHGDLGSRLVSIFETVCERDFDGVLAIGVDTPTLPLAFVRNACLLLGYPDIDAVVGPAHDGGYYLVGLKEPQPSLFREIPWSTDRVFALTMNRAVQMGLRAACLPAWPDVDTAEDLERLVRDVDSDSSCVPHTRAQLVRLGLL